MKQIETVWAFVNEQEDGSEGLVAVQLDDSWFPLVCTDVEKLPQMVASARAVGKITGKKISMIKFTERSEAEVIK